MPVETSQLSTQLAPFGPYFRVHWDELGIPPSAAQRIRAVSAVLGRNVPERVNASVAHLDLVSRVLSPLVGAAVVAGIGLRPATVLVTAGEPIPVLSHRVTTREPDQAWAEEILRGPVAELDAAFHVSLDNGRIRKGNVVSAINGAGGVLNTIAPEHIRRTEQIVGLFLNHPNLLDSWTAPPFLRNSCCLIYQAPGHGMCGDCALKLGRR